MKIIKFNGESGTMFVKLETLEDLWTIQRILFKGDRAKSKTLRKFKTEEGKSGDMKEVMVKLSVEKVELDKSSERLRIAGKILEGYPLEYIKLNSYHTLNIAISDMLEVEKDKWASYILDVIKNAVTLTKKPRLGIIAIDDEKILSAYLLGYGISFRNEIYSHLSKRLTPKEFNEMEKKFYDEAIKLIKNMEVESIIIAGPGFTKDDLKKYIDDTGLTSKLSKRLFYINTSNTERSGIYELIRSDMVSKILDKERIREEFILMEQFLKGLSTGQSRYGIDNVKKAMNEYEVRLILVNDSVLGNDLIQKLLSEAEKKKLAVEVFNSTDEVGMQLSNFKDIASI
ncbi:MAG: mRNA surveillance protein pelota [Candidatus Marsarchaeota archaeon]|nr:mRNA surveillance protein pelota [Candidatus Marsarchaeota archaeon]